MIRERRGNSRGSRGEGGVRRWGRRGKGNSRERGDRAREGFG